MNILNWIKYISLRPSLLAIKDLLFNLQSNRSYEVMIAKLVIKKNPITPKNMCTK